NSVIGASRRSLVRVRSAPFFRSRTATPRLWESLSVDKTRRPQSRTAARASPPWPSCVVLTRPGGRAIVVLLHLELRVDADRVRDVEVVGRRLHHVLVDLAELLERSVPLDADGVADRLVARPHAGIDPEESAQVELTIGLDLHTL